MNKLSPYLIFTVLLAMSIPASAEVLEPNTMGIAEAFDAVVGNGAYSNVGFIAKGLTAAISLAFSGWATFGLFQAHFVEDQIPFYSWLWLQARVLIMQSIIIILVNL